MTEWHQPLLFLLLCLLENNRSDVTTCFRKERLKIHGLIRYQKKFYCCLAENLITVDEKCIECSIGYKASDDHKTCVICDENTYGKKCVKQCKCNNTEKCDNIVGCINKLASTDAARTSQSSSIVRPNEKHDVNIKKKESTTLNSNVTIYVAYTGGVAAIIGLSILFRQYCYRQTNTFCWKTKNSVRIANHGNRNNSDYFQEEISELERHGSIYNIIDEQNMIENIEHLQ